MSWQNVRVKQVLGYYSISLRSKDLRAILLRKRFRNQTSNLFSHQSTILFFVLKFIKQTKIDVALAGRITAGEECKYKSLQRHNIIHRKCLRWRHIETPDVVLYYIWKVFVKYIHTVSQNCIVYLCHIKRQLLFVHFFAILRSFSFDKILEHSE